MSKIISVHSFRGGTGKSNITANVAVTIAQQGRRVAIVDTDITSPGIHVLFGLGEEKRGKALNDYLWGNCAIEETAYDVSDSLKTGKGKVIPINGSIYLIPSSIKTGEITRMLQEGYDVGLLNDGFREIVRKLNLDFLLLDTHPGINEETLLSIAISDTLLVIMRPDQQDYQGTAVIVEIAGKLSIPRVFLVINKVLAELNFTEVKKQVEETYDCKVAGVLPLSEDMVRLGSAGLFSLLYPDHPFTEIIKEITSKIL